MEIHLIWAQDYNSGIGKKGNIPWHISEDLKHFKKLTQNSIVIMGRKTWDSLPFKPLPSRRNIVLSSRNVLDVECYKSIDKCLKKIDRKNNINIFIIGGAQIYKLFFNRSQILHITLVNKNIDGIDTFFPISFYEIEKKFIKTEETQLSTKAIYTKWIKL